MNIRKLLNKPSAKHKKIINNEIEKFNNFLIQETKEKNNKYEHKIKIFNSVCHICNSKNIITIHKQKICKDCNYKWKKADIIKTSEDLLMSKWVSDVKKCMIEMTDTEYFIITKLIHDNYHAESIYKIFSSYQDSFVNLKKLRKIFKSIYD